MKRALKKIFDEIVEKIAKESLLKHGHQYPIVLLIGGTKNEPEITKTIPIKKSTSDDEVRRIVELFRRTDGAFGYMTVNDGTTTVRRPSQHPEKKEAILVGLYTPDFQKAVMFVFERRGKEIVFTDEVPMQPLTGEPLQGINLNQKNGGIRK